MFWVLTSLAQSSFPEGFVAEPIFKKRDLVSIAFLSDDKFLVTRKEGNIFLIKNDQPQAAPAGLIPVDSTGERGLMGIAVHPDFGMHPYIYVYYTVPQANHNRLSRFKFENDQILINEEEVLIDFEPLNAIMHNSGALKFGPDGKLYVSTGDGHDPQLAQQQTNLLGKILRLNPDGSIPTDNPFYFTNEGRNKAIFAYGFRNPFTFDFSHEGRLFVNDVGEDRFEEINEVFPGKNYGWPFVEGYLADNPGASAPDNYIDPFYRYSHAEGCAVTGAAFYHHQANFPEEYHDKFFFGDFCTNTIRVLDPETSGVSTPITTDESAVMHISFDGSGNMYFITWAATLWKVSYQANNGAPFIKSHPESLTLVQGETATMSVAVGGEQPFAFQWYRDGVAIEDANGSSLTIEDVTIAHHNAQFYCTVTNARGTVQSNTATLTVSTNPRPVVSVDMSDNTELYLAGDTIIVTGFATDAVDGILPLSALTWRVDFHHDLHAHPLLSDETNTDSIAFIVPRTGELSSNVWFRIHLSARNSTGLTTAVYRDIHPLTSTFTITSNHNQPVKIFVDGKPYLTPASIKAVAGMTRNLYFNNPAYSTDEVLLFQRWNNDHEDPSLTFDVHSRDTVYTLNVTKLTYRQGGGLSGRYFNGRSGFEGIPDFVRTDQAIDFNWLQAKPAPPIDENNFSIAWEGYIRVPETGTYNFYILSDDGVRLWIDNELLIDQLVDQAATEHTGSISLAGGTVYPLRIHYFDGVGNATVKFYWSSNTISKGIVPGTALYPKDFDFSPSVSVKGNMPSSLKLGESIDLSVEARDHMGDLISPDKLTWRVVMNKPSGTHALRVFSGSDRFAFSLPDTISFEAGMSFSVIASATDNSGLEASDTLKVSPAPVVIQFKSPVNTTLVIQRDTFDVPVSYTALKGHKLVYEIPSPVTIDADSLCYLGDWENGLKRNMVAEHDTTVMLQYDRLLLGAGDGLNAQYFRAISSFEDSPVKVAVDERINHRFDSASGLKVHWYGWMQPPVTGRYLIMAETRQTATINVEGETVFSAGKKLIPVSLVAGRHYAIDVYYAAIATGSIALKWSSALLPTHLIPRHQLFSELPPITAIENNPGLTVDIYPNPVSKILMIEGPEANGQGAEIIIYNIYGLAVKRFAGSDKQVKLDVSDLTAGMYVLKVKKGLHAFQTKFVKH